MYIKHSYTGLEKLNLKIAKINGIFEKRFYPHLWIMLLYAVACFFIENFLPDTFACENSPLENAQLILLVIGIAFCLKKSRRIFFINDKFIWQAGVLFYSLLFGREISWGRVFFIHPDGVVPDWSEMGIYAVIAHPLVGIMILSCLFLLYRGRIVSFFNSVKIPFWDLIFLLIFIALVYISEHCSVDFFHGEVYEELFECAAYLEMLLITFFIGKYRKYDY